MSCDKYARMIIKQGSGIPTVPASPDHRDGTWIITDIYEGEQYQDILTGITYTRNGSDIVLQDGTAKLVYKAILTQAGAIAPIPIELQNTLDSVTANYIIQGQYTLVFNSAVLTSNRTFIQPVANNTFGQEIKIVRTNTTTITIKAFDATGTLTDGLFPSSQPISVYIEVWP